MRSALAAGALLAMAGCNHPYPQDIENTTDRLEQGDPLRLGIVSGTGMTAEAETAIARIAGALGTDIERSEAPAEILIDRLDKQEVDLVIGEFAKKSPVSKDASLSDPIGAPEPRNSREPVLRLARKHGENRWVILTDRIVG